MIVWKIIGKLSGHGGTSASVVLAKALAGGNDPGEASSGERDGGGDGASVSHGVDTLALTVGPLTM